MLYKGDENLKFQVSENDFILVNVYILLRYKECLHKKGTFPDFFFALWVSFVGSHCSTLSRILFVNNSEQLSRHVLKYYRLTDKSNGDFITGSADFRCKIQPQFNIRQLISGHLKRGCQTQLRFVDKTPTQLSRHRHNIKASWILE
jgi:hypothetical protein